MKKVVSILLAMTVLCALFAGCTTNTPDDNSPQNNSTSDTSPADNPRILVLDEPTRGIDVSAKAEIYALINNLTAQGMAILLVSSELPEIMGISDRIIVMHDGEITGEFQREEFSEQSIMTCAIGRRKE